MMNWNVSNFTISIDVTTLQPDTQYNVSVFPYIEGFKLGRPANVSFCTLPPSKMSCLIYKLMCSLYHNSL